MAAGLSSADALRAATQTPARMMGVAAKRGQIAVGQAADLVLLRGNPLTDIEQTRAIDGVVLRGAWLPREKLEAVLTQARAARER